jgi:hypothetical protein
VFVIMVEQVQQLLDFEQACQLSSLLFLVISSCGAMSCKDLALGHYCRVEI